MDLDSFIAKYRAEWQRLDDTCSRGTRGLAKLSGEEIRELVQLYLRASAHLAEAQTRYGDPRLEAFLSGVVGRAHGALYGTKPRSLRGGMDVLGTRYREAVRATAPFVLIAAGLFVAVVAAVAIWVATSAAARAGIFPPYVKDVIRRAGGGRADVPIPSAALSSFILVNNVSVAFLAFALGITLGVGTLFVVVQNAVLLGALAGAFASAGRAGVFWALVLPHGLLEITAICLAAGAGLRMGWSVIDPGERRRSRAVAEESRAAVMVVLGVIPAFAVAALIEGFVTGSSLPDWVEIGLGAAVAVGYVGLLAGRPRRRRPEPRWHPEQLRLAGLTDGPGP